MLLLLLRLLLLLLPERAAAVRQSKLHAVIVNNDSEDIKVQIFRLGSWFKHGNTKSVVVESSRKIRSYLFTSNDSDRALRNKA